MTSDRGHRKGCTETRAALVEELQLPALLLASLATQRTPSMGGYLTPFLPCLIVRNGSHADKSNMGSAQRLARPTWWVVQTLGLRSKCRRLIRIRPGVTSTDDGRDLPHDEPSQASDLRLRRRAG